MALFLNDPTAKRTVIMPEHYRPPRASFDSILQQLGNLNATISKLEHQIGELQKEVRDGGYISRSEFNHGLNGMVPKEGRYWLVERLVFGAAGLVLLAALGAMLYVIGWQR